MKAREYMMDKIYSEGAVSIDDVLEAQDSGLYIDDFIAGRIDGFQVETIFPNDNGV